MFSKYLKQETFVVFGTIYENKISGKGSGVVSFKKETPHLVRLLTNTLL